MMAIFCGIRFEGGERHEDMFDDLEETAPPVSPFSQAARWTLVVTDSTESKKSIFAVGVGGRHQDPRPLGSSYELSSCSLVLGVAILCRRRFCA